MSVPFLFSRKRVYPFKTIRTYSFIFFAITSNCILSPPLCRVNRCVQFGMEQLLFGPPCMRARGEVRVPSGWFSDDGSVYTFGLSAAADKGRRIRVDERALCLILLPPPAPGRIYTTPPLTSSVSPIVVIRHPQHCRSRCSSNRVCDPAVYCMYTDEECRFTLHLSAVYAAVQFFCCWKFGGLTIRIIFS